MSIQAEITRLQELKSGLRAKLVSMIGMPDTATLEQCVDAVCEIADNGAPALTIDGLTAMSASIPAGYSSGGSVTL